MKRLLRIEFLKLQHSKGFRVLLFLSALLGFFATIASTGSGEGIVITGYDTFYKQFGDLKSLIFVFLGVFSGIFIGEDFSNRIIQSEISSGYSRFAILLSKSLMYMIGIFMIIASELLVATIGTTVLNGFGPVITLNIVSIMIRSYLIYSFIMSGISMICIMIAFLIKNKGSIIAINMLLLVIIDGVLQFLSSKLPLGLQMYDKTPFYQVLLTTSPSIMIVDLVRGILVGMITLVIFFSITHIIFLRSELK